MEGPQIVNDQNNNDNNDENSKLLDEYLIN